MVRHSRGAMNIQVRDGLPYVTVTLLYGGQQLDLANVLLDTGSAGTLFAADQVLAVGLQYEADDPVQRGRRRCLPHYLNSKEPGKRLLPRYPTSLAKNCVFLCIRRQAIAQKGTIPVPLPRCWLRLPLLSLPQSLLNYRQTLPTSW